MIIARRRLDSGENLAPVVRELAMLNESLQTLAYAALGQSGPQVQRRLAWLLARAASAGPGLSAGRDAWREGIAAWAAEAGDEPPA